MDISGPHSLGMAPLVVLPNTAVEVDMDTSVAEEVDTSPTELDIQDYTASRTYVRVDATIRHDMVVYIRNHPRMISHRSITILHTSSSMPIPTINTLTSENIREPQQDRSKEKYPTHNHPSNPTLKHP